MAVRVFGWTGAGLAIAALLTSRVLGPMLSNPNNRHLEWLISIPLGLGVSAVVMLVLAFVIAVSGALWRWWRRFAYPPSEQSSQAGE